MEKNRRKRIAFLPGDSIMPWMQRDIQILQEHFEVSILRGGILGFSPEAGGESFAYSIS
jgi:hypothetical protein